MAVEHSNTMAADHAIECGGDGIVIGHGPILCSRPESAFRLNDLLHFPARPG